MRRITVSLLKEMGLMPFAYKARMIAATVAPRALVRNLRFWLGGAPETLPIPRAWARLLVSGSADIPGFLASGRRGFDCIRETLERNGTPIEGLEDVLDFGVGCGRVLRHWQGHADKRIFGTDMNDYLVEECRRCVPFARVGKNSIVGQTSYADRSFDLVYAFSVFTHLDIPAQNAWLVDFRRILRPRGILLLTVHGKALAERLVGKEREDFDAGRPVVRLSQFPGGNLCSAFHPESYVRKAMTDGFEIVDAVPEGAMGNLPQDLYMLRRLD